MSEPKAFAPHYTLKEFLEYTRFPKSTISWMIATPGVFPKPNFFRVGSKKLYITHADTEKFIAELAEQGYTNEPTRQRRTKAAIYKGGAK